VFRRIAIAVGISVSIVAVSAPPAFALPSQNADDTLMTDGKVRAIVQVGDNIWIGGAFSKITKRNGDVVANVTNVAVFDAGTGAFRNIAPDIPGDQVWDMDVYGSTVVIGGKLSGPGTSKNLVTVNGSNGSIVRWYNAPLTKAVLAASDLDRIYAGGVSLSAFQIGGGKLWTRARLTIDDSLRGHKTPAAYRDIERDGNALWAACQCDTADGSPSKALIKLDTDGRRLSFNPKNIGSSSTGIAVEVTSNALYLGAGGSDWFGSFAKNGDRNWLRDTSGSTQTVTIMDNSLVIGGHFVLVADAGEGNCGFRPNNLNPENCTERKYLAAYTFSGSLLSWAPSLSGKYNGAWALHVDGGRLHVGGEFTKVNGKTQRHYARFS
jgi:hypothetical protein